MLHVDIDVNVDFLLLGGMPLLIVIIILLLIQTIVITDYLLHLWFSLFLLLLLLLGLLLHRLLLQVMTNDFALQTWILFDKSLIDFNSKIIALAQLLHIVFQGANKLRQLGLLGYLQAFLDDVISEIVNQEVEVLALVAHQAIYDSLVHLLGVKLQTLFNHIRAEFLLREVDQIAHQFFTNDSVGFFHF
jgi:hypothetical protein